MKQTLKKKVGTIRDKMMSLIDDLQERMDELSERDDPEGIWQEEMDEIEKLIEVLDEASCNLDEYEF